jgi:hypothetical protein
LAGAEYSLPFSGSGKATSREKIDALQQLTCVSDLHTAASRACQGLTQVTMTFGAWNCIDLVM